MELEWDEDQGREAGGVYPTSCIRLLPSLVVVLLFCSSEVRFCIRLLANLLNVEKFAEDGGGEYQRRDNGDSSSNMREYVPRWDAGADAVWL